MLIDDGFLHVGELQDGDATRLIEITRKYPQADFADATLVVLAEGLGINDIARRTAIACGTRARACDGMRRASATHHAG